MANQVIRAASYVRSATKEGSTEALQLQSERIEQHATHNGYELVREYRGFVRLVIAVGVFENTDSISTFAIPLHFVWIVVGFRDVDTPAAIPGHGDRFPADVWFGGVELQSEPLGRDIMFD